VDNLNVGAYILLSKFSPQLMHMTSIVLELTTVIPNIIFLHSILSILIAIALEWWTPSLWWQPFLFVMYYWVLYCLASSIKQSTQRKHKEREPKSELQGQTQTGSQWGKGTNCVPETSPVTISLSENEGKCTFFICFYVGHSFCTFCSYTNSCDVQQSWNFSFVRASMKFHMV
jgi:hypothetical protein